MLPCVKAAQTSWPLCTLLSIKAGVTSGPSQCSVHRKRFPPMRLPLLRERESASWRTPMIQEEQRRNAGKPNYKGLDAMWMQRIFWESENPTASRPKISTI